MTNYTLDTACIKKNKQARQHKQKIKAKMKIKDARQNTSLIKCSVR